MMGCSLSFQDVTSEPRFVNFNLQIGHKRLQLGEHHYKKFKTISKQKGIEVANYEVSQEISHDYKIYMMQNLEGKEADEAFEYMTFFMTYKTPLNSIYIMQHDIQMMESCSDFLDDIGGLIDLI
jgi:hypothetical protein